MSKSFNTLIAALILAGAGSVVAASSVDLTVRGLITPSACEPTLSNSGAYDIGKISAKDLNVETYTRLKEHTMQLVVICDAPTLVALENQDNRAGSEFDEGGGFGLGLINGTQKLGVMSAWLTSPLADGVAARTITSQDSGSTWQRDEWVGPGYITSVADSTTLAPIPVQQWTADLLLKPIIAPTKTLTLTNEVPIDGSVTITVRYL